jgi:glycerate kinase
VSPPKVVIAPDKFKGSLSASEAARAIESGVKRALPDANCVMIPMADGGEGTVDAFLERGAGRETARVHGPLGAPVDAAYALDGSTAIVEMASASGLGLLDRTQYDPTRTDTFGTGELLRAALDCGARHLIVGIGGSATNDCGIGMLRALGVQFYDARGAQIEGPILAFRDLESIDLEGLDQRIPAAQIDVAVDVDNPLCGPNGAARTFAAQKGASEEQIEQLDATLQHIADVSERTLHRDHRNVAGAGAAGGLGFALVAFLGAHLQPGVRLIAKQCGLGAALRDAQLCLTGEGKIDLQTLHGKTIAGVAEMARECGVRVIAFGGAVEDDARSQLERYGIEVVAIAPKGTPVEESIGDAARLLEAAAATTVRF